MSEGEVDEREVYVTACGVEEAGVEEERRRGVEVRRWPGEWRKVSMGWRWSLLGVGLVEKGEGR